MIGFWDNMSISQYVLFFLEIIQMQHEKTKAFNFHFRLKWEKCIIAVYKVHVKLSNSAKTEQKSCGKK